MKFTYLKRKSVLQKKHRNGEQAERIPLALRRPSEMKEEKPAVKVFPSGREVCNHLTKAGRDEYERRKRVAWESQTWRSKGINKDGHFCAICNQELFWKDTTCDHIQPRKMGGGSRDDTQENLAAVHWRCNIERGSKRKGFYGVD